MADGALDLLAGLVLDDAGRRWGELATDFQWDDARAVLDTSAEAPPFHFLTRSRGSSKTLDLAGVAVAAMLTQCSPGSKLYACAADKDQERLIVESIEGFAQRTGELKGALVIRNFKVTATKTRSTLEVLPADAAGSWGLRPAFVIVDELAQWAETGAPLRLWEAMSSAAAKLAGCRMACLSTAGSPSHWAHTVLEHALADPMWHVHQVAGPAPWIEQAKLDEQQRRLPDSSFRRLFLNQWVEAEDRLANVDDLQACVVLDGPLAPEAGRRYVCAVDVGLKHDACVAMVCHGEPVTRYQHGVGDFTAATRVVLDRMMVWQGTKEHPVQLEEVGAWVYDAWTSYRAHVRFDPWQAADMAQRLRARGIHVEEFQFSSASVGRLGATLHVLIKNHLLALPDDDDLVAELAAVRLVETRAGTIRMDHVAGRHDDMATALAMCATWLLDAPPVAGPDSARAGTSGDRLADMIGDDDLLSDLSYTMRF